MGMSYQPDIVISDKDKKTIAVVEVKDRHDVNRFVAAEIYKRFLNYTGFGDAKFFLVVTRDSISLWKKGLTISGDLAVLAFHPHSFFDFFKSNSQRPLEFMA